MRWYEKLYIGKKAVRRQKQITGHIERGEFLMGAYVITAAVNGNNILDIYPTEVLLLPFYKDRDFLIIGISDSYWESLEVVRQIVDDMYQLTGGFDLDTLLHYGKNKEKL